MTLAQLLNRPCTLILNSQASTTEDAYGNPVVDAPAPTVETVCELQGLSRDEPDDQGEFSDTVWRLFLPAGTEIETSDAVLIDGVQYELVGEPDERRNPRTQTASHIEATVRRTAGAGEGS